MTRGKRKETTVPTLTLPTLIFLVSLKGYPLLRVAHDSFFHVSLIKPGAGFVGLDNSRTIMVDEWFEQTVVNTIYWTVFPVLGEYLAGMITAILLNREFRGGTFFRTVIFIPWLVPIIVAGTTWGWILNTKFGIVNFMPSTLRIVSGPIGLLGGAKCAMTVVILISIQRPFPYYTISFLSVMRSISGDPVEATVIDGVGVIKQFFYITLPQLKSVSLVTIFLHIIWTAINFDFIWILTEGGPNYATQTLPIMIYRHSIEKFNVSTTSALSTMMFVAMAVIFVVHYRQKIEISGFLE